MNAPADLFRWPLAAIARALRDGSLTARAMLSHFQDRIERLNPVVNAFAWLDPAAHRAADVSDEHLRAGRPRSELEGIPVAVKDNLLVAGQPATWGSPLYQHYRPTHDELPVARLRAAGAILIGKTNVPEFTLQGYTCNPLFGASRNPWNPALTPGGSSGGAAAAVAAGLVPLALCTDGGGSIRRPAALTHLLGFKPSTGRLARHGGFPALLLDCEVVGPIARSTEGARRLFECLAGPSPLDPSSFALPPAPAAHGVRRRIHYVDHLPPHPVDRGIQAACLQGMRRLEALGHTVTHGPLPFDVSEVDAAWSQLGGIGLALLARRDPEFAHQASPAFVDLARAGAALSAADLLACLETLQAFRRTVRAAFAGVDIIATPCSAAPPWPATEIYPGTIDGASAAPRSHAAFTGWVNACGHPAISLPVADDPAAGLAGLQLIGDFGADRALLDLAQRYETAHPWTQHWPALATAP
ncbi:amidase [Verticiella sediminum]|uniref:Amidase n=1 Tax=Verticiella sediminum TaxID=1247510 RepID=A0A556AKA7_9BURK|nr:amidase [Verticiella sediminum]TSH93328.1 amidase [Verticiella sediminum]